MFQNFSLYPRWSVRKNLEFPLRAPGRNIAEAEIQRRIAWAAELLHITRYLDREASRLSGGEMQRVAIGRAIVRRPRLFLMDEPLTNLDAKLREALRVELVELRRELGTPMVFVTHDQAEALSMADRIVVLSEGRILQTGHPAEIYERPVSPVVALQLGQPAINLLPVRREGGQWRAADGTPLLRADAAGPGERLLGIRPETRGAAGRRGGARRGSCVSWSTPARPRRCWSIGSGPASTSWSRAARPFAPATACVRASIPPAPSFRDTGTSRAPAQQKQGEPMTARAFEPKFMKMSVLTAALQELTPRRIRDEDPDRAIEDWLAFARELDCPNIQISAALHPTESDVPPEAMLDPVANTLDLRKPFDKPRAKRVQAAMQATGVGATDIAFFDNLLHDDNDVRRKKHDFVLRMMDAAALLGPGGGLRLRRPQPEAVDGPEPRLLRRGLRPAAQGGEGAPARVPRRAVPDAGLDRRRQLPQQHRLRPRDVDRPASHLRAARRRRPVPRPLRPVARDLDGAGHTLDLPVPQGRRLRLHRRRLPRQGSGDRSQGRRGLGIRRPDRRARRLDRKTGKPSPNPADQVNAWKKQTVLCEHELPGTAKHDPLGYLQNRTVDWLDHQLAARELLKLDVANTALVIEHEYPRARIQDKERLAPILKGSIAFARKIDEAAACMYALHHEVLPAQDIPVQGRGRVAYWT